MNALDILLLLSLLSVIYALVMGNQLKAGRILTGLYTAQLLALIAISGLAYGSVEVVEASLKIEILNYQLHWRFDALSWFFSVITLGAALLSSWFSCGEWGQRYQQQGGSLRLFNGALALNVLSMLVLLGSGDFLSLFIGWEFVSWASFLMMALGSDKAIRYAMRYLVYAFAGAMAVMAGIAIVYSQTGSFEFQAFRDAVPTMSNGLLWTLVILFTTGFGVKMALIPFHLWQAKAYAQTVGPGAVFMGAISARMGLFAMIVILVQLIGVGRLADLQLISSYFTVRDLLAWIAVLTLIFATYTAMRQHEARRLLAWHGIGQGGYMVLGLMVADDLGSAGGLLHVFNYAACQAVLFMAVISVMHRTGTADLNRLGGLVARMPLSFLAMLIGIIGLAGLPPMNGFVSKWLIYRSLIMDGSPMLFLASVIGTLGTILSVYKLIHNMFLGQLRVEHENIKEAPMSMMAPMMILSTIIFVTGYFPGLILDWVASVQAAIGVPVLAHNLGGVAMDKGGLNMIWIVSILLAGFLVGWLVLMTGGKSRRVHQLDNYAGGHFLTAKTRYQYSDNFYPGLMHIIGPLYRKSFQWAERGFISAVDSAAMVMQGLYRQVQPVFFLLLTLVLSLYWVLA